MKCSIPIFVYISLLFLSQTLAGDGASCEIQGGYGLFRADDEDVGKPYQLYGWDASLTHFFTPTFGLTARVSSGYGDVGYREEIIGTSAYGFMVGPTVKLRQEKLEPFAHALFTTLLIRADRGTYTATGLEAGTALGGGLDYRVTPRFSFRAVQFDYLVVRAEGLTLHNFKLGAGMVMNF